MPAKVFFSHNLKPFLPASFLHEVLNFTPSHLSAVPSSTPDTPATYVRVRTRSCATGHDKLNRASLFPGKAFVDARIYARP